jgi:hypothetical protein
MVRRSAISRAPRNGIDTPPEGAPGELEKITHSELRILKNLTHLG